MTKDTAQFLLNVISELSVKPAQDGAEETIANLLKARKELLEIINQAPVAPTESTK